MSPGGRQNVLGSPPGDFGAPRFVPNGEGRAKQFFIAESNGAIAVYLVRQSGMPSVKRGSLKPFAVKADGRQCLCKLSVCTHAHEEKMLPWFGFSSGRT